MASVKSPSVRNPSVRAPSVKAPSVVPGGYDEHEAGLNDKLDRLSVADRKSIAPAETDLPNGDANVASGNYATEEPNIRSNESDTMALGSALATDPRELEHETEPEAITEPNGGYQEGAIPTATGEIDSRSIAAGTNREYDAKSVATGTTRLTQHEEPSRSYLPVDNQNEIDRAPIAVVTNWEDEDPAQKRRSVTGSKAPSVRRQSTDAGSLRAPSVKAASARPPSRTGNRPASVAGSRRNTEGIIAGVAGGAAVGEVMSPQRQRDLQQRNQDSGISLNDQGAIPRDRSTTFDDSNAQRSASPRPMSPFGHRPQPNLMTVTEDGRESRYEGRDSRSAAMLGRSGTVLSRANTLGRNGTLSRAANGGTVGSRRGAFGRGAGTTIGTQPEEVLGRDDIHTRAEVSERILDEATLRRLSTMEKKDAARLAKVIKQEGKAEAAAVKGSIKELEALVKLQKEAAYTERKSQMRLSKWTTKEHRARLRFLKEKERYERIEGELRNAENDYEERRDHAGGLTAQVAEKTQELDDLRGQKAADDREREVKLLALKNPAHS